MAERIVPVARVTLDAPQVLSCLTGNHKVAVFSPVPDIAGRTLAQLQSQLVSTTFRQMMQQLVPQPEVAGRFIESHLELGPGTVETVRSVDVLLDQ